MSYGFCCVKAWRKPRGFGYLSVPIQFLANPDLGQLSTRRSAVSRSEVRYGAPQPGQTRLREHDYRTQSLAALHGLESGFSFLQGDFSRHYPIQVQLAAEVPIG